MTRSPSPSEVEDAASDRRRRRYRVRTLMLGVASAAAWFAYLRLPGAWGAAAGVMAWIFLVLAVLLVFIGLVYLGFGLFALFDRFAALGRRSTSRPEPRPVDDWWA